MIREQVKPDQSGNTMKLVKVIGAVSLLAGTLDILAAVIQTLVLGGSPVKMLQYIASGVFGAESFSGGNSFAVMGLAFHYVIALIWTSIYFLLYPKIKILSKNWVLSGLFWGLFIWGIMNLVVLPLSNVPQSAWNTPRAIIALLILIGAMGLPISYLAYRFYSNDKT
jgi:hypothetical protein